MDEVNRGVELVRKLKNIGKLIKRSMGNHFEEMGLTQSQGMLIGVLCHQGNMKISDLSEKLGLSKSTVSGIMDRLEKQGLVERERSKEDKRIVFVSVTEEFLKNFKENFSQVEKKLERIASEATTEELDTVLKGLDALENIMRRNS